jgi:hypothetical protein
MKRCKHCGIQKPTDDFYGDNAARDGLRPECKACTAARRKRWYEHNRDREIARVKAWAAANPGKVKAASEAARASGRKSANDRRYHLKRKYGITPEQYDEMLEAQGGGCAICHRPPRDDISLHVDHDHETGAVRGLLCFRCNNSLGDLNDDAGLLQSAASYLDAHDPVTIEMTVLAKRRVRELTGAG